MHKIRINWYKEIGETKYPHVNRRTTYSSQKLPNSLPLSQWPSSPAYGFIYAVSKHKMENLKGAYIQWDWKTQTTFYSNNKCERATEGWGGGYWRQKHENPIRVALYLCHLCARKLQWNIVNPCVLLLPFLLLRSVHPLFLPAVHNF